MGVHWVTAIFAFACPALAYSGYVNVCRPERPQCPRGSTERKANCWRMYWMCNVIYLPLPVDVSLTGSVTAHADVEEEIFRVGRNAQNKSFLF